MFRFILPAIGLLIILTSIIYFLFVFKKPTDPALANISPTDTITASPVPLGLPSAATSSPLPLTANANEKLLENKISSLEASLNTLSAKVNSLNQSPTANSSTPPITPTASAKPQAPVYITLGSNGELNDQSYTPVPGFSVSLNPTNFPSYTNVVLEATVSRVQPGGTANLQLFNQTTNQAISASTLTTSSASFTLVGSSPFQLATGTNTYVLTLQSSDNTNVQVGVARLRINFN